MDEAAREVFSLGGRPVHTESGQLFWGDIFRELADRTARRKSRTNFRASVVLILLTAAVTTFFSSSAPGLIWTLLRSHVR